MQQYISANFSVNVMPPPPAPGQKVHTGLIKGVDSGKPWTLWKHQVPWQAFQFPSPNSVVILMIREPCSWMGSVNQAGYELFPQNYKHRKQNRPWTLDQVAFKETPSDCNGHLFTDAVSLWRFYAHGYISGAVGVEAGPEGDVHNNVVIVRYEDLISSPTAIMATLHNLKLPADNTDWKLFHSPIQGPSGSGRNRAQLLASLSSAPANCTAEMMTRVRTVLRRDEALLGNYGYKLPSDLSPVEDAETNGLVHFYPVPTDPALDLKNVSQQTLDGMAQGGLTAQQALRIPTVPFVIAGRRQKKFSQEQTRRPRSAEERRRPLAAFVRGGADPPLSLSRVPSADLTDLSKATIGSGIPISARLARSSKATIGSGIPISARLARSVGWSVSEIDKVRTADPTGVAEVEPPKLLVSLVHQDGSWAPDGPDCVHYVYSNVATIDFDPAWMAPHQFPSVPDSDGYPFNVFDDVPKDDNGNLLPIRIVPDPVICHYFMLSKTELDKCRKGMISTKDAMVERMLTNPELYKLKMDSGGWVKTDDLAVSLGLPETVSRLSVILRTAAWMNSRHNSLFQVAAAYDPQGFIKHILAIRFTRGHQKPWFDPNRVLRAITPEQLKLVTEAWCMAPGNLFQEIINNGVSHAGALQHWCTLDYTRFWPGNLQHWCTLDYTRFWPGNLQTAQARRLAGGGRPSDSA